MKRIHWYILALAILSGFAGEVWPNTFAWGVTLSIWAVRAYVIVQSHSISQRIGKRWAYATTAAVSALSIWYVAALANAGIVSPDQARALHILNVFLVVLEVYVGILQSPHPDSVELAKEKQLYKEACRLLEEAEIELQMTRERVASLEKVKQIDGKEVVRLAGEVQALRDELEIERMAAAKIGKQLARLQDVGCIGGKVNGRYFAFEAGKYAEGAPIMDCITLADSEAQLRSRTGYSNGQLKIITS